MIVMIIFRSWSHILFSHVFGPLVDLFRVTKLECMMPAEGRLLTCGGAGLGFILTFLRMVLNSLSLALPLLSHYKLMNLPRFGF